jgi:hypothetical protein
MSFLDHANRAISFAPGIEWHQFYHYKFHPDWECKNCNTKCIILFYKTGSWKIIVNLQELTVRYTIKKCCRNFFIQPIKENLYPIWTAIQKF